MYNHYLTRGLLVLAACATLAGCKKEDAAPEAKQPSSNFNYATTQDVALRVSARLDNGSIVNDKNIQVFDADPRTERANLLAYGLVNPATGVMTQAFAVPRHVKSLFIKSSHVGLRPVIEVPVQPVLDVNMVAEKYEGGRSAQVMDQSNPCFTMPHFDAHGRPHYIDQNNGEDAAFLARVNSSIPEGRSVPQHNPAYIAPRVQVINITSESDVFLTFLHEGAMYKNALGFFTFPTGQVPTSAAAIQQHQIAIPNASYNGDGGKLNSGDRVKLGHFPAGTSIGWFIAADAWMGPPKTNVDCNKQRYYSVAGYNPGSTSQQPHTVQLYDQPTNRLVVGFEDLNRTNGESDDDFNDVVFYINTTGTFTHDSPNTGGGGCQNDRDNDGICDSDDQHPDDPNACYNHYYPGKNKFGSLTYEDLWPAKGDYDFNDLVVDYRHMVVTNAQGRAVRIEGKYKIRAIGASFRNGFGVQLPVSPAMVQSVQGSMIMRNGVTLAANGCETGQDKAVFFAWDDAQSVVTWPSGSIYFNTELNAPKGTSDTITVVITFNQPVKISDLGASPWNPFIFVNQDRGREVHLANYAPTTKANASYFGKDDDRSNPATGTYYLGSNNMPWALQLPESFDYPIEKANINTAHLKFDEWASSNGAMYPDWYQNKPGYRNGANIYR